MGEGGRVGLAILALAAIGGCGPSGPARPPEADPPAAAPAIPWLAAGTPEIASPTIPWLDGDPITRPCASGWREEPRRSGIACEPWPAAGRSECTGPSAHFPAEPGCRAVGTTCPAGEFAEGLPAGAIHVRPGATGATGTSDDPVGTIAEALALAGPGGTIALSRGSHALEAPIGASVELRGACAEATRISGLVRVAGGDVAVRDAALVALRVEAGLARASGVWIEGAVGIAVDVAGGMLVLDDAVVRGGEESPSRLGRGIQVAGGRIEATRVAIEGAPSRAVYVAAGGSASISGSVIDGTRPGADGWALGVYTAAGAGTLALSRSVVEGGVGALVALEGGTTTIDDVLLRDATVRSGDAIAVGLQVSADATARGLEVRDVVGFGIAANAGELLLEDVVVSSAVPGMLGIHSEIAATTRVRRARLGPIGIGIRAYTGGRLDAEDVLVFEASDHVLMSRGDGASATVRRFVALDSERGTRAGDDAALTIEDAVLRDIASAGLGDDAFATFLGSTITARRVVAERIANSCFAALQEGGVLTIEDARCAGGTDIGVVAGTNGTVDATRLHVEGARMVGLASDGGSLRARDVLIESIGPTEMVASGIDAVQGGDVVIERARLLGIHGYATSCSGTLEDGTPSHVALADVAIEGAEVGGMVFQAHAEATRISVDGAAEVGIAVTTETGLLHAEDVTVRGVAPRGDQLLGRGVHVGEGARLEGARLVIAGAHGAGLIVTDAGSTAELSELWVSEVEREACGDGCADRAAGSGIVAMEGGAAHVVGLRSWGHALAGVQVASGGRLELADGWVFDNPIGRSVLTPTDPALLTTGVVYVDDEVEESTAPVSLPATSLF